VADAAQPRQVAQALIRHGSRGHVRSVRRTAASGRGEHPQAKVPSRLDHPRVVGDDPVDTQPDGSRQVESVE
ncbi:MAG: hypothetical protein ACOYXW_19850, partial [Actinomycetota bacterium]